MNNRIKIIIGVVIVLVFVSIGFFKFMDTKIEYVNFQEATAKSKVVEVKGVWLKDKETKFDPGTSTFEFYMKDDFNTEMKVIYPGGKPNNFEVADAIVVKGQVKNGSFHAKDILTKCPSKYEGNGQDVK